MEGLCVILVSSFQVFSIEASFLSSLTQEATVHTRFKIPVDLMHPFYYHLSYRLTLSIPLASNHGHQSKPPHETHSMQPRNPPTKTFLAISPRIEIRHPRTITNSIPKEMSHRTCKYWTALPAFHGSHGISSTRCCYTK